MATILVVDDEVGIRELLSEILSDEGHVVLTAENAAAARSVRGQEKPDLILLDIWMPDTDGVTLLKEWAAAGTLTMPVIMMSGHATIDTAVEATRFGALDFLEKPIAMQRLLAAVRTGLERGRAPRGPRPGSAPFAPFAPGATGSGGMTGSGPAAGVAAPFGSSGQQGAAQLPASSAFAPSSAAPRGLAEMPAPVLHEPNRARTLTSAGERTGVSLDQPLRDARDAFERVYFEYHLARENYSMTRVADRAGLERTHLYRKLKQLGVELARGSRRSAPADDGRSGGDDAA